MRALCAAAIALAGFAAQAAEPQGGKVTARQLSDLYQQVQQLQREMMELRGVVEEQSYRIRTLEKQRLEDYQNLDRRLQQSAGSAADAGSSSVSSQASSSTSSSASRRSSQRAATGTAAAGSASTAGKSGDPASEREAYQQAFQLLKQQQLKQAELAYTRFLKDYPNGRYSANAHYWLGELYLTDDQLKEARDTFKTLINRYPSFRKTPESAFKLAKIYNQLGDATASEALLKKIVRDYRSAAPDTAKAANEYLQQNFR
jgi:tol-pal system protein YbgF